MLAAHETATQATPTMVDLSLADSTQRRRVSGPGLRAFLAIADQWKLGEEERRTLLGRPGRSTYHGWAAKARAGQDLSLQLDTLLRLSAVLGIHKALVILFPRAGDGVAWLRTPNRGLLFGGQAPLDLLLSGTQDGLLAVRRHLDAWRGGTFTAPIPGYDDALPPLTDDDIVYL
ncbi:MbcA/ParS/Xre antitoxin family protein [Nitrospirillum iridis]|uniref:DUF2384 domain-containing protein n=1 Tax=Nitrospirillum iridis TaxID=765888 RepID=A0A7X0EFQ9_9PROT|nr:MbcA/ParS/Xre antitoxin family protein [Nitrospirillum iridis]MBB6255282.1 hypothetical protein [Nitrospirillum iridis]